MSIKLAESENMITEQRKGAIETRKASELKVGDTIMTMTGEPVKLTRICKGFYANSLFLDWGVGCNWACVSEDTEIQMA